MIKVTYWLSANFLTFTIIWLLLFTYIISLLCTLLHFYYHCFFNNLFSSFNLLCYSPLRLSLPFCIPALSLHLRLPHCPQSQQTHGAEWARSALCGEYLEYLHSKWAQPDFNEAAAFPLGLLFIRLMSDHQRGSSVVPSYHWLSDAEGKCHKLNGLISWVGGCWPK